MIKILSVAEKPSVAKELAKIISDNPQPPRRTGYSPYNAIFDIPSCTFRGSRASMILTSVTGHLMEIEFDPKYRNWSSCPPADLFGAPVHKSVKKENEPNKSKLFDEPTKINVLLLLLDCDLEGENIAYEVISVCKEANPRMEVYRARFSALIPRDILRTLNNPERPNEHFNDAVEARQEIDLRLGAAFTRFQTLRLQSKFKHVITNVVSYGPCQFPTLGFIVDRHLSIQAFRPEKYWTLSCELDHTEPDTGNKMNVNFTWDRGNVFDRLVCGILFDACVMAAGGADNCRAEVCKCDARSTRRYRPAPLNTVELQKRASTFLHMSSDRTMAVAEALYQRGILSYPRTETDFFKEGFELMPVVQEHTSHSSWGGFAQQLANGKFEWPKNGGHDDQAHPPIHPTKCVELNSLENQDEKNIYELVSRHFLACCAQDGIGDQTNITICIPPRFKSPPDVSGSYPSPNVLDDICIHSEYFSTTGLMIRERNWLDVYSKYEKWTGKQVPVFRVGDLFQPKSMTMTSGQTYPPAPLSESDLISEMDKNGIGTDATIATHISTVQQREYAAKDAQGRFVPTKLGLALIEAYNDMGYKLNKPFLRAAMEKDCQLIAKGEMRRVDMVRNCLSHMKACFIDCNKEATKLDLSMQKHFAEEIRHGGNEAQENFDVIQQRFTACGKCNNPMILRSRTELNANTNANFSGVTRQLLCTTCDIALSLPSKNELLPHDHLCPLCNYQVITVHNSETGKDHTICPHCFKNPPPAPFADENSSHEFRCFSCANAGCPLSGRLLGEQVLVVPCAAVACTESLKLRKTSKGYMLCCTNQTCTQKWWFPKFVRTAQPLESTICTRCTEKCGKPVHKLHITVNLSVAPPGTPSEMDMCLCCDPLWSECQVQPVALPARNMGAMRAPGARGAGSNVNYGGAGTSAGAYNNSAYGSLRPDVGSASSSFGGSDYGAAATGKGVTNDKRKASTAASRGGRTGRGGRGGPDIAPGASVGSRVGRASRQTDEAANESRMCLCGQPASVNTVNKEGPNKGRPFAGCSVKRGGEGGCKFFEWLDEGVQGPAQGLAVPAGARITPSSSVTCSKCNDLGHYARECRR
jgi:DNA topoisomerase-3